MKLSRLAVSAYVGFVFLSGILIGGAGYCLYEAHGVSANARTREEIRHAYLDEMHSRLKLNQVQVKQLTIIVDDIANRFDQLRNKVHEQVWDEMRRDRQRIHAGQVEEINAILNPDQKAEYQKMREERQRRRKEKEAGQGGSLK